ncbi:MAG: hypothetical protein ACLFNL_08345 [Bacteroidales bacterium]
MPKNNVRLPGGKFASKKDVKPAIFSSTPRNYSVVMESREIGGKLGKKIDFSPNGMYKTKDQEEIEFLKRKAQKPGPVSKVNLERDIQLKEEVKNKKKGKGDK